jgi:hypothetical protein
MSDGKPPKAEKNRPRRAQRSGAIEAPSGLSRAVAQGRLVGYFFYDKDVDKLFYCLVKNDSFICDVVGHA